MTPTRIVCIRHGESTFNAAHRLTGRDPGHIDARLTERGQAQVAAARADLHDIAFDLVVTSPLTRAIQTTKGIFSGHPAEPKILVEVLHRECQESSCDMGRAASVLAAEFPDVAVDHLPEIWWHEGGEPDADGIHVEPRTLFDGRVAAFRDWLAARPEGTIAVVGHGTFFYHLTGVWLDNCETVELDLGTDRITRRA
ncbi:MAG: histidine phosphatase family protein [Methylobacterium sp.]|jgi:broad specificity phosphatase PhoE|uniref:histidine phosphatase family protein n=1 Tax=unclassified Methylobacterium TaxID=2615210 RepID=UPI0011CA6D58|nr:MULTISPECIES: histidine phosphatase family protein [unclassified Methylobacterium]MDO9425935.1 histidine phosphatase family protein [Methylobacterium sp.]TXM68215.1 histidine phosphatase family protein [Methylobacterium sp. WL69]